MGARIIESKKKYFTNPHTLIGEKQVSFIKKLTNNAVRNCTKIELSIV